MREAIELIIKYYENLQKKEGLIPPQLEHLMTCYVILQNLDEKESIQKKD